MWKTKGSVPRIILFGFVGTGDETGTVLSRHPAHSLSCRAGRLVYHPYHIGMILTGVMTYALYLREFDDIHSCGGLY